MGLMDPLTDLLTQYQADPLVYLLIFFVFCVLASIILPLPIEMFLVIDPVVPFAVKAVVMGLGKGAGAIVVFLIGAKVEQAILRFAKWGWFRWLLDKSERLVRKYGYVAMFAIMAIPGMVDTIPLYIFSILNKEGKLMTLQGFAIVNVLAGIARAGLIYLIITGLGWNIFNVEGAA